MTSAAQPSQNESWVFHVAKVFFECYLNGVLF